MIAVDIELNNGSILKGCLIFKESHEGKLEMIQITDKEEIEQGFIVRPWGNEVDPIYFQNEDINGRVVRTNVKRYEIIGVR